MAATIVVADLKAFSSGATFNRVPDITNDPVGVTDAVTILLTRGAPLTESVGLTDAVTTLLTRAAVPVESVGLTDSLTVLLTRNVALTDAVGITDSRTTNIVPPAQIVVAKLGVEGSTFAPVRIVVSRLTADADSILARTEPVGITDSVTVTRSSTYNVVLNSTFSILDTGSPQTLQRDAAQTEPLGLTDSINATLILGGGGGTTYNPGTSDAVGLSDSIVLVKNTTKLLTPDSVGLTDSLNVQIYSGGLTYQADLTDHVGMQDVLDYSGVRTFLIQIDEAVDLTDGPFALAYRPDSRDITVTGELSTHIVTSFTKEYVRVELVADEALVDQIVSLAIVKRRTAPRDADWRVAPLEGVPGNKRSAALLVGRGTSVPLLGRSMYDVWCRIEDNPEIPAFRVGVLLTL